MVVGRRRDVFGEVPAEELGVEGIRVACLAQTLRRLPRPVGSRGPRPRRRAQTRHLQQPLPPEEVVQRQAVRLTCRRTQPRGGEELAVEEGVESRAWEERNLARRAPRA